MLKMLSAEFWLDSKEDGDDNLFLLLFVVPKIKLKAVWHWNAISIVRKR
jgi:hypothetical protein